MTTAYIFAHLCDKRHRKPVLTIHQPEASASAPPLQHWTKLTGTPPSRPDCPVEVHIGTSHMVIQSSKGIFWTPEAAEAAAQESCLQFLASKCFTEDRVHISWMKQVFKNTPGATKETTWARTFHSE